MDLLKRELARKKSVLEKAASDNNNNNHDNHHQKKRKYMKQSEIRRLEEEQEEEERYRLQQQKQKDLTKRQKKNIDQVEVEVSSSLSISLNEANEHTKHGTTNKQGNKGSPEDSSGIEDVSSSPGTNCPSGTMTPEQLKQLLRSFGLPICFFGESQNEKQGRLQAALTKQDQTLQGLSEMEEFRLGQGFGIRNPFLEKEKRDGKMGTALGDEGIEKSTHKKNEDSNNKDDEETEKETDDDPVKRIYKFLKGLLRDWEQDLEARPKSVAMSVAGRNESMTFKQCSDYIRPLFKQLKRRKLEAGM